MLDADGHAFGCAANPSTHTAVRSAVGSVRSRTERRAAARPSDNHPRAVGVFVTRFTPVAPAAALGEKSSRTR